MLTDKQFIALSFLANTVNNEADLVFLARGDRGTKKLIRYAFALADTFLEVSNSEPTEIIKKFQEANENISESPNNEQVLGH